MLKRDEIHVGAIVQNGSNVYVILTVNNTEETYSCLVLANSAVVYGNISFTLKDMRYLGTADDLSGAIINKLRSEAV